MTLALALELARAFTRTLSLALTLAMTLALALAGCATPGPADDGHAWTTGRLLLRVDAGSERPAQSLSAGFELRGDGTQGELRLNSPLGPRLAQARWAPGLATLNTAAGESRFEDLQALAQQIFGEPLPLQALTDWLAGRPWPGAPHQTLGAPEPGFTQLGWEVSLARQDQGWIEARRVLPPAVLLRARVDPLP